MRKGMSKGIFASSVLIVACVGMSTAAIAQPPAKKEDPEVAQTAQLNRANRLQRHADMAAYDAAVRAHHRRVLSQNAHYLHMRLAYAAAMTAWREQVAQCKAGNSAACNAPTPDPVNFF